MSKSLSMIVAYDQNKLIGIKNKLPWHLSADLKRFKSLTTGNAVIMGYNTYRSIGRPLPNRHNIVLTNEENLEGCDTATSLDDALDLVKPGEEPIVIGGAQVYALALPHVSRLYVTEVAAKLEGDAYFPDFDLSHWQEVWREEHSKDKDNQYDYTFTNYEKIH